MDIDISRLPLVRITWDGTVDDDAFRQYLETTADLIAAHPGTVLLHDARRAGAPSALQRRLQAEWMHAHEHTIRRNGRGTAFVIESALVRGALTAILWLQPLATEELVTASMDEALAWAEARIARGHSGTARPAR